MEEKSYRVVDSYYEALVSCWPERGSKWVTTRIATDCPVGEYCHICGKVIQQDDVTHYWQLYKVTVVEAVTKYRRYDYVGTGGLVE